MVPAAVLDLRPLVDDIVIPIIVPTIGGVVLWLLKRGNDLIVAKLKAHGLDIDAKQRATIDDVLDKLVAGEVAKVSTDIKNAGPMTVSVKGGGITANLAQQAINHAPDALGHFGITSASNPQLETMIENRIAIAIQNAQRAEVAAVTPAIAPAKA